MQLATGRQLGQVDGVFVQGAVVAFSPRVVYPVAAPHLHQSLIDLLLVNAKVLEHVSRVAP